jgi:hypothetical protein
MAKRLRVNFNREVGASKIEENGQSKPCAMGVGWVNQHTLETLEKRRIQRTDAWGRPLPEKSDKN